MPVLRSLTVAELRAQLMAYPADSEVYAYEGESQGLTIMTDGKEAGFIADRTSTPIVDGSSRYSRLNVQSELGLEADEILLDIAGDCVAKESLRVKDHQQAVLMLIKLGAAMAAHKILP